MLGVGKDRVPYLRGAIRGREEKRGWMPRSIQKRKTPKEENPRNCIEVDSPEIAEECRGTYRLLDERLRTGAKGDREDPRSACRP